METFGGLNREARTGEFYTNIIPGFAEGAPEQEMRAITSRLAPGQRIEGSGTTSDRDIQMFVQAVPSVDKKGSVNKSIRNNFASQYEKSKAKLKKFNSVNDSLTTDSKFYFNDTVKFAAYTEITGNAQVSGNLNVGTNIVTTGNITADSIAGIGAFITDVNANTLKGQDTTKFARTDTLTTEGIKGIWNFWNTVRFYTTVTFDVTPVFNAVVNFANGINVTGTATFNSDVIFTGWQKVGASSNIDKYTRDTIIRFVLPNSTGGGTYANHGIADWRSIRKWNAVILEDSTNRLFTPMTYYAPYAYYAFVESTRVYIETLAGSYPFKNDTAIFYITVADMNR